MKKDVETIIGEHEVTKRAVNHEGHTRLQHERMIYERLGHVSHVAELLGADDDSITIKRITGEDAKTWLHFSDDWSAARLSWTAAKDRIEQYVDAEMALLNEGILYRDMNLEHIMFANDGVVLLDLEEALVRSGGKTWNLHSYRGTWETMAPEEFSAQGELTERVATYRVAVIAHLALTGKLPFPRQSKPRRHQVHKWRKEHPPAISPTLSRPVRKVFTAALSRKPEQRQADPRTFLVRLENAQTND